MFRKSKKPKITQKKPATSVKKPKTAAKKPPKTPAKATTTYKSTAPAKVKNRPQKTGQNFGKTKKVVSTRPGKKQQVKIINIRF